MKTEAAPANKTDVPLLIITSSSRHLDKEEEQIIRTNLRNSSEEKLAPCSSAEPERAAAVCARAKRVR